MSTEADMKYLLTPDFFPIWNVGCFSVNAQDLSEEISRDCDELAERILPLAKGEAAEDFDEWSALIDSIEEKASEVRAIESLLIKNCQDLRENLTEVREGFWDE